MSRKPRTKFQTCAITDAGGVVHLGAVNRTLDQSGQTVAAYTVMTVCRMRHTSWTCRNVPFDALPRGFDLPKTFHEGLLLVKYEPANTVIAPIVTCVVCATWPAMMDFDAP